MIAESQGRPVYAGLLPPLGWKPPEEEVALTGEEVVRREMGTVGEGPTGTRDA